MHTASRIISAAVIGLDAEMVDVEADTGGGEHGKFTVVGLPDTSVSESRERVRSALKNSGFDFPRIKVTVNLAPADLKKHGPSYDLPIAISVLAATKKITVKYDTDNMLFIGELALNGLVRPVAGVLPVALEAKNRGIQNMFVPEANAAEAKMVGNIKIFPVRTLLELADHLERKRPIEETPDVEIDFSNDSIEFDMAHIRGQDQVKRAMEIAAAGAHNMMMGGPPGSGKTLIARTLPSILPDLSMDEALEITKIYSVAGELSHRRSLVTSRPFRSPHHTASGVALVGGGTWPRPGEISMAHRGVLFLDEFPEFTRQVLENLRQPLEDGVINISRAAGNLRFPAKFILMAAMNPCPCGFFTDKEKECTCTPSQISNYNKKISGPILDRIDIHVEVPRVKFDKLSAPCGGQDSPTVKTRIQKAREIQKQRFKNTHYITNSEMSSEAVKRFCPTDPASQATLKNAVDSLHLSARSYFRTLKLARTIADLEESGDITKDHVAEALRYRPGTDK